MDKNYKALLEKQQYAFAGDHSAVKICSWTKKSLRGEGVCYKEKFYGIKCHRCLQMSPSVNYCGLDCIFCWRERHDEPYTTIDDPKLVVQRGVEGQRFLLSGFGGNKKVDLKKFKESLNPKHVAISLTGEPLTYPKINELIREYHKNGFTTFVVTNGQYPKVMKKMQMPTQLYVSLDAPNEELLAVIDRPKNKKIAWKNLVKTLDVLKSLKGKTRTTIRITIIKGINDLFPEQYAALLERCDADFVEVKGYMFVGASRERLEIENMPLHKEVKAFAGEIAKHCAYKIIDEQGASRVVLMMKKDSPNRIISFD
ncbi:MAG: 4-demethylwyosine synthase TYW1 [Nanoarchaeota archaeon]|nr:4-demethylwyosine synthase TYW1 [Nanoarchaeota archaeon]MBU1270529.1 4-demethylwyosine synthase TYW1 [Nanoarchaeota archaeon]MBU1604262.1 4-demethylwyosine synthase TYW1 [Nanoarchaeota archaeon]MBU2442843.1 4-demethylwyosine synthase TYW1 [Nanoarchaeota archaeon]